ncbi:MAG: outer membrane protein assembly factor BamD [Nitrospina sp.]|jgi:outer membrane protein assembly factor BamD|nr:outer membrane protein assembly factor BamD [Nitrospina sp.]MBT6717244.1 outer membrane protein assembly factor BamD [Nitrospina sp.]
MFRTHLKFPLIFFLLVPLLLNINCSTTQEQRTGSPAKLLREARQFIKEKDSEKAKNSIQLIMEDFPDSKERITGLMLLADVHYNEEEYEEAKFHYQKFTELYPAHRFVDRAHFYKAMANFQLSDLASRDLTPVHSALEGFENFINDFPNSTYKGKAQKRIQQCLDILAQNIFEIGKFYFRTGSYQSAIIRLKSLMLEYPTHAYVAEAEFLLAESYLHEQNYIKAREHYKVVLQKHPRTEFAKQARLKLRELRKL